MRREQVASHTTSFRPLAGWSGFSDCFGNSSGEGDALLLRLFELWAIFVMHTLPGTAGELGF